MPPPPGRGLKRQETFRTGMRQNAAEYDAATDLDASGLNYAEFCALVRDREAGEHEEDELRERFRLLDVTGSGRVEKHEYLRFSLRDALARGVTRVAQVFEQWDVDGNGSVDVVEFRKAIRSLGFDDVREQDLDAIFHEYDEDGSGSIERRELERRMRKAAGIAVEQRHQLRRVAGGRKGAALSTTVRIDRSEGGKPVAEQLRDALAKNAVRVIDLFRSWDEDGNGLIDKGEFYKAMAPLGIIVSHDESNELFSVFDPDGSGTIEYHELHRLLRQRVKDPRSKTWRIEELSKRRSLRLPDIHNKHVDTHPGGAAGGAGGAGGGAVSARGDYGRSSTAVSFAAAYRAKLNSFSDVWFHPRHGQEWRQKYSKNLAAPPVLMPPKTPRELNATRSPRAERSQMLIERGAEGYPEP